MSECATDPSTTLTPAETEALLRAHGVTLTRQRIEIAAILLARAQHLSADELLNRVNQAGLGVSKATIYNTLGLFARKGLVREVIVDPSKVFYDSNTGPHHHIYDLEQGRLTDIRDHEVRIEGLPELPEGTEVAGVDVIVRVRGKAVD